MNRQTTWTIAALALLPLGLIGIAIGMVVTGVASSQAVDECAPLTGPGSGATVDPNALPEYVGVYHRNQLVNAVWIIRAGYDQGMSVRDQTIGVMTAMGESSLRVLDHGDADGPDSRGLFQQRDHWGPLEVRMDPYGSSVLFYKALAELVDRDTLAPTIAAHRVQRNDDPHHYERYWPDAIEVVEALTSTATDLDPATGHAVCDHPGGSAPPPDGQLWVAPADGPITSMYGWRTHPITGKRSFHTGIDLGAGCGEPIAAVSAGTVITTETSDKIYGGLIEIDHGDGVLTRYGHMWAADLLVGEDQSVTTGQVIAAVGSAGLSTGCHLHFEVHVGVMDSTHTDPLAFLSDRGVTVE